MATEAEIIRRVRKELGDLEEPFRQTYRGTGMQDQYDLPSQRVSTTGLKVFKTDPVSLANTNLVLTTDFTLDAENGVVTLTTPLTKDWLLTAEGVAFGMFTDDEIAEYVHDAVLQHTNERFETTRYRSPEGFIRYERSQVVLDNLPEVEEPLVAILATIEALWALATDASTDIDVTTSEGTHVSRGQRFAQLQTQIALLTEKYQTLCAQLNVGLFRIEVSNLRRVSRTTNRLVPIFVEREYDDNSMPVRITPEIDTREADWDGPPSPAGNSYY
jgi:hypothetical protein